MRLSNQSVIEGKPSLLPPEGYQVNYVSDNMALECSLLGLVSYKPFYVR